jgi:archaellin
MNNLLLAAVIAGVVLGVAIYLTSENDTTLSDEIDAINDVGTGSERAFNAMS